MIFQINVNGALPILSPDKKNFGDTRLSDDLFRRQGGRKKGVGEFQSDFVFLNVKLINRLVAQIENNARLIGRRPVPHVGYFRERKPGSRPEGSKKDCQAEYEQTCSIVIYRKHVVSVTNFNGNCKKRLKEQAMGHGCPSAFSLQPSVFSLQPITLSREKQLTSFFVNAIFIAQK